MSKILLVANTDWYLYNFRLSLIRQIKESGHIPVLISPSGPYAQKFVQAGFEHIPWQVGRQSIAPWHELSAVQHLKEIYRQQSPDLVHHHTHKAVLYGTMAAQRLGIPVVNSIPGRGYVYSSTALKAKFLKPILEMMFQRYLQPCSKQVMIFENHDDQTYFTDKGFIPSEKAILIPSVGVDLARFDHDPAPETNRPIAAFVGRMLWSKGVGIFAAAARLLREKRIPCRLILVGLPDSDHPENIPASAIEAWVSEGILEWWGWQDDINQVYQKINILAHPTQYGEGVPTTLIEAAASRRAIIASDWPGCREVITHGQTGLLIEPGDINDLADKITTLVRNPALRTELADHAYQLVHDHFGTQKVNQRTLEVYGRLLSES
jgi:glycosyltransferase involved in cell wall biosynthesis